MRGPRSRPSGAQHSLGGSSVVQVAGEMRREGDEQDSCGAFIREPGRLSPLFSEVGPMWEGRAEGRTRVLFEHGGSEEFSDIWAGQQPDVHYSAWESGSETFGGVSPQVGLGAQTGGSPRGASVDCGPGP